MLYQIQETYVHLCLDPASRMSRLGKVHKQREADVLSLSARNPQNYSEKPPIRPLVVWKGC